MRRRPGTRRPRVAIVAASASIIGGHSVQADALASALASDGIEVHRIAIDRALPAGIRRRRGVRTLVNEAAYGWALRRLAVMDVVHAFSASYWSFLLAPVPAMLAGRALGRRVVLHYHSGEVADHLARWGKWVHPWLRLPHEIVVCSRFQQDVFREYGYPTRVIPNLVDLGRFRYRDRAAVGPRFICTRNLERHYGVDVIIAAFARIRSRYPDATLVVAGAGSQRGNLEQQAAPLGQAVTFVGAVAPHEMSRYLDAADVFLNASRIDNQPVSLLEAAASGLPIISTPVGGIPELIAHDRSGWLVGSHEPEAFAQAAEAVLGHPGRARAWAARARADLSRFTWNAVRDDWADAYGVRLPTSRDAAPVRGEAATTGAST